MLGISRKIWVIIITIVAAVFIAIAVWQWDKWYSLYTETILRISKESKSKETKLVEKSARYDNLPFESDLTLEQHRKINELSQSFKKILILFEKKSWPAADLENAAQEMFSAERDPRGRDKYSRYQSRRGLAEEREADSLLASPPSPKIVFSGADTIALVRVHNFYPEFPDNLKRDLDILTQFGISKFVFDLRDNQGGLEDSAILALGLFMRKDDIIGIRKDQSGETIYNRKYLTETFKALDVGKFRHLRNIVLLVNKNTASAAEIFSGAMQEWGCTLIGEKTFGKGVGQEYFSLPSPTGSVFILTTRELLLGKGKKKLNGVGLTPDILVRESRLTPEDDQMETAIKFLQNNPQRE